MTLGIRPEHITIGGDRQYRLDLVEPVGNEMFIYASANGQQIVARIPPQELPPIGAPIALSFDPAHLLYFDATTGERITSS